MSGGVRAAGASGAGAQLSGGSQQTFFALPRGPQSRGGSQPSS